MKRARTPRQTPDDPGVAEVRRWRDGVWKRGGSTLKGAIRLLRASQAERESAGEAEIVRLAAKRRAPSKKKRRAA